MPHDRIISTVFWVAKYAIKKILFFRLKQLFDLNVSKGDYEVSR